MGCTSAFAWEQACTARLAGVDFKCNCGLHSALCIHLPKDLEFVPAVAETNYLAQKTKTMSDRISLDKLELFGLEEDPRMCESLIEKEQYRAQQDPLAQLLLETCYWEADREQAFRRYLESRDFSTTLELLRLFNIPTDQPLAEIGGGSGFLSWALAQNGFQSVCLLEPNSHHTTGTGYLRTRQDAAGVTIENSLSAWYASPNRFQSVITRNCVHHFKNIAWIAACIRQKIAPGGYWVMIREPFVDTSQDLYRFMHTHPYSQRYGVFEFAFPPSHFVDALELAGFQLRAIVPEGYSNNCLSLYSEEVGTKRNAIFTRLVQWALRHIPRATTASYRVQSMINRLVPGRRCFARPQVMLFQRKEVGEMPVSDIWYPLEEGQCPALEQMPQLSADSICAA